MTEGVRPISPLSTFKNKISYGKKSKGENP